MFGYQTLWARETPAARPVPKSKLDLQNLTLMPEPSPGEHFGFNTSKFETPRPATETLSNIGDFLAWETGRKLENPKIGPGNACGGAPQNRGALGSARKGADRGVHEGKQQEKHLREHFPEHSEFGEHPCEHSRELFWGFPISGQSPRPGSPLLQTPEKRQNLVKILLSLSDPHLRPTPCSRHRINRRKS